MTEDQDGELPLRNGEGVGSNGWIAGNGASVRATGNCGEAGGGLAGFDFPSSTAFTADCCRCSGLGCEKGTAEGWDCAAGPGGGSSTCDGNHMSTMHALHHNDDRTHKHGFHAI